MHTQVRMSWPKQMRYIEVGLVSDRMGIDPAPPAAPPDAKNYQEHKAPQITLIGEHIAFECPPLGGREGSEVGRWGAVYMEVTTGLTSA